MDEKLTVSFTVTIPLKEDTAEARIEALRKLKERLKIKRSWKVVP